MKTTSAASLALLLAATPALANNGTNLTGYGSRAQGMGGVALALPQDSMAAASNPAGMAYVGNRYDLGFQIIGARTTSEFGPLTNKGSSLTPVPEIGFNWQYDERWSFGITTAASGAAMKYDNQLFTGGTAGTDGMFMSVAVLPTVSYKVNDQFAVGFSLAATLQGLQLKNMPGVGSDKLDWATGLGWRAGFMWQPSDTVSIGGMYSAKVKMGRHHSYQADILASVDGKLDAPEQYGIGIAFKPTPKLTIGADYLRINWSDTQFNSLFGWRDQDILRLGTAYEYDDFWTFRAGTSITRRHISSEYVTPNLLLSAINPNAVTLGATRKLGNGGEINFGIEYDFPGKLTGTGPSTGSKLDSDLVIVSIGYGKSF